MISYIFQFYIEIGQGHHHFAVYNVYQYLQE